MGILKTLGIVDNEFTKTVEVFESLFEGKSFLDIEYHTPKEYVGKCWQAYNSDRYSSIRQSNLNGKVFEMIIYTLLYRENIRPIYTQAKVAFVPNIEFDTILYSRSSPVSLSLKTSLRERYKQADLEAIALKYVHRRSKCYLLTLSGEEAIVTKNKISNGAIIGLDQIIDCNTVDIDCLINDLKCMSFEESKSVDVVEGFVIR